MTQVTDKVIPGEGRFLLALNTSGGFRAYAGLIRDTHMELVLKPGAQKAIDEGWLSVPALVRDFQGGVIELLRSSLVPDETLPLLDPKFGLVGSFESQAKRICYGEYGEAIKELIELDKMLPAGGRRVPDVAVDKPYLKGKHLPFLSAVLDLESRHRARPQVLADVQAALERIEAL